MSESALDLRLGELAIVVPLVLCLIGLSAWPNLISGRAAAPDADRLDAVRAMIVKPHVDWFALAPSLALLGASGLLLMVAVFVPPAAAARRRPRSLAFAGFVASGIWAAFLDDRSPTRDRARPRRDVARPVGRARAGDPRRVGCRRGAPLVRRADARRARRRVLRAPHRGGRRHGVLRAGREPDDAVPRARVVLDRALRADGDRHRPRRVARGGAQVPRHRRRRLGDAALRLRARLRRSPASCRSTGSPLPGMRTTRCSSSASR